MAEHVAEWGGSERIFRLRFGDLMDLEEACGKVGIGEVYLRLVSHRYFAREVYHTIRLALKGGGLPAAEAKRLMDDRFDATPMIACAELAVAILLATMSGIPADETKAPGDPARPFDAGAIFASFLKLGLTPDQVRAIGYRDFVAMMRASGGSSVQPPTDEEFEEMLRLFGGEVSAPALGADEG